MVSKNFRLIPDFQTEVKHGHHQSMSSTLSQGLLWSQSNQHVIFGETPVESEFHAWFGLLIC